MSHIERLIAELCPDGVEFKRLGEVSEILNGFAFKSAEYTSTGVRIIRISDVQKGFISDKDVKYYPLDKVAKIPQYILYTGDLVVSLSGSIGRVAMVDDAQLPAALNQRVAAVRPASKHLMVRFLYHYLNSTYFENKAVMSVSGGTVKNLSTSWLRGHSVPVPPMEVQQEIVRILDNFSQLEAELKAELKAELEARRKQYEFYSDVLLTAFDTVQKTQLGELCGIITTGKLNANARTENGQFPFFTCDSEPYTIDTYAFEMQAILISGNGSQLGHVNYYEGKFNAYQRTYILGQFSDGVSVNFMLHILKRYFRRYALSLQRAGSVPYITMPMLQDFPIPLPPLEEQERIVEILDKFDALVNDLSIGLPAELQARRKQYEYYRDRLLTFEELSS